MKNTLLLILGILTLTLPLSSAAQVPNEGLANRILAARQQDATLMQQYNWNSRTEILHNGNVQDIRIDLVTPGPGGQLQRSLLNDTPSALPNGFLRKAIAENQRKQMEEYLVGLRSLAEQYTMPSGSKVLSFIVQAQIQPITSASGTTLLQITGNNVVVPGDTFSLTVDGTSYKTRRVQVTTTYQGDPVTMTATFTTMKSGFNFAQYSTVEAPSKNITVMIHNFDFVANN